MTEIRQAVSLDFPETDELRYLPEGPYPLGDGAFSWVGIQHGADATSGSLNLFDLTRHSNRSFTLPGRPGFAFPCNRPGLFVVGCERSLGLFEIDSSRWNVFCEGVDADVTGTIINDGLPFEDNLIFGTKDLAFAETKAGLYLWRGRDRELIRLRDDQLCSNGKAMRKAPDGTWRLIDIDSPTRRIVEYPIDIDQATLGDPQVLIDLTRDPGVPDGAVLTPDGNELIVSIFLPQSAPHGETRLYDLATGNCRIVWETSGSPQNTCPALVRVDDSLKLVITTAVEHLTPDDRQACPHAGHLFVADTDLKPPTGPLAPTFTPPAD